MSQTLSVEEYLRVADRLSAAPRVLPKLLEILEDPAGDVSKAIELISFDPALTAKVLRASNSAYVGMPEPARDVTEAVNQLGLMFVYQLVAGMCAASTLNTEGAGNSANLWRHAVTTALAAQLLAEDLKMETGLLFTAAMLHEIGKAVFAEKWREKYWSLVERTRGSSSELLKQEEEAYGLNHAQLGGRLLAQWKFPPAISACVWHQHAPLSGMPFDRQTACINLANAVAEAITEHTTPPRELLPTTHGQERALAILKLNNEDLARYLSRTQENFEFVETICQPRG